MIKMIEWLQDYTIEELHQIHNKCENLYHLCLREKETGLPNIESIKLDSSRQILQIDPYTGLYAIKTGNGILYYATKVNNYQHLHTADELEKINKDAIEELSLLRSGKDIIVALKEDKYIMLVK